MDCSDLYASVHSSIIHNSQNVETTQGLSTNEWINNIWYTQIMKYYSAIKRNKILIFATAWMSLQSIILSKITQ